MADKKYYLSKIRHKGRLLNVKDEEARADLLYPVDASTLTPQSTFRKNAVIGINGVLYRATEDTGNLPVRLVTNDDGTRFVTSTTAAGLTAFQVADTAVLDGWEIFTDASVAYWVESLNARMAAIENTVAAMQQTYEADGISYTAPQLLAEMAKLMGLTVVTR